jgi:hypothetical protein
MILARMLLLTAAIFQLVLTAAGGFGVDDRIGAVMGRVQGGRSCPSSSVFREALQLVIACNV